MSVVKKEEKGKIIQPKKMGLLVENPVYKPFRYPWCYEQASRKIPSNIKIWEIRE